jgi:hypothetical protein
LAFCGFISCWINAALTTPLIAQDIDFNNNNWQLVWLNNDNHPVIGLCQKMAT